MRKLLFLLTVLLAATACSSDDPDPIGSKDFDDWNNPSSENYKPDGYNPIKGDWILTEKNGSTEVDFLVYRFSNDLNMSQATKKPAEDKDPTYGNKEKYAINNTSFKAGNDIYTYNIQGTLEKAVLTLKNGSNTLKMKPYESGVWRWKGDWNNPKDTHYAQYQGKYNPIKGTWKLTHVDGKPIKYSEFYRFSANFVWERSANGDAAFEFVDKYTINDTGFEAASDYYKHQYFIKDNILTIQLKIPLESSPMTFKRYK